MLRSARARLRQACQARAAARCYASAPAPLRNPSPNDSDSVLSSSGFGQPLPSTHPHLLKTGELTIGIQADEYELRRRRLMDPLENGAVVIIAGARTKYMSNNIFYKFRQASNLWYLTGWEEPDSVLVLDNSVRGYKMTLFSPGKDAADETWNGPKSGREGAKQVFGADEAYDITLLSKRLHHILRKPTSSTARLPALYVDIPGGMTAASRTRARAPKRRSLLDLLIPSERTVSEFDEIASILAGEDGRTIRSAGNEVEKLRLCKSPAELALIRRSADIAANAHAKVMSFAEAGKSESALVAHFGYHCALGGAARPAYVPVCASGTSALTIHYTQNQHLLQSGDMVLLDGGCEYAGYASDITRTFPVSGKFTSAQRDLYEAVLLVEKESIKLCEARNGYTLEDLHRKSCDLMRGELRRLGFSLKGGELERTLYPHFLSHPIGVDLHDTPSFPRHEKLKAGMVVTIEPGVYVPPWSLFPKEFHNMAIRIEDEVLIEEDDHIVLSVDAPKEAIDVEACCQRALQS